jgi:hypothetical protein
MYVLELTSEDRRAFDWVGDRYIAGQVASILIDLLSEDRERTDTGLISFDVPEAVAWEIQQFAQEEGCSWPCFGRQLRDKLSEFLGRIV